MSASSSPTFRPEGLQAEREIAGGGRLADAALAGCDRDHMLHAGNALGLGLRGRARTRRALPPGEAVHGPEPAGRSAVRRGEDALHRRQALHGRSGGLTHTFHAGGFGRLDEDREHHPAASSTTTRKGVRMPTRFGAARIHRHGRQGLQHMLTGDRHDESLLGRSDACSPVMYRLPRPVR